MAKNKTPKTAGTRTGLRSQNKAGVAIAKAPKPAPVARKAANKRKMTLAQGKKASSAAASPKRAKTISLKDQKPEPERTPRSSRIELPLARRTDSVLSLADGNSFHPKQRTPRSTLDDLKGMDETKECVLEDVICPFVDPQIAAIMRVKVLKGVLLTGVPGTGKTTLVDAIVSELRRMSKDRQISYYQESGSCMSKYFGESEQNLRNLFQTAKANAPAVILLDELDALGRTRSDGPGSACMYTILTTLLEEINELTPGKVLVIAATNCPQFCDRALLRKGRFDIKLDIPLPGPDSRESILSHYLEKKGLELDEEDMEELVRGTKGLPGSDLEGLVDSIHRRVIKRAFPGMSRLTLSRTQILKKMREIRELDFQRDVFPELELAGGVEE